MSDEKKRHETLGRMVGGGSAGERLIRFRNALEMYRGDLASVLGGVDVDHFIEVTTTALMDPKLDLEKVFPPSVFLACRRAAQLKLRPDGDEGALIPYWNGKDKRLELAFQPMYKGLIRTVLRTGMYRKVEARLQFTGDTWIEEYGLEPRLVHVPAAPSSQGGLERAYAIVWGRDGTTQFEVMHIEEMDEIRANTKKHNNGKEGPAWSTKFGAGQMYRKMPVKRLAKFLELDSEQAAVFWYDDQMDRGRIHADPGDFAPELGHDSVHERMARTYETQVDDIRSRIDAEKPATEHEPEPIQSDEPIFLDSAIPRGKHRGKTWREVVHEERSYVRWVLSTDFIADERDRATLEAYADKVKAEGGEEEAPQEEAPVVGSITFETVEAEAMALAGRLVEQKLLTMEGSEEMELLIADRNMPGLRSWIEDWAQRLEEDGDGEIPF